MADEALAAGKAAEEEGGAEMGADGLSQEPGAACPKNNEGGGMGSAVPHPDAAAVGSGRKVARLGQRVALVPEKEPKAPKAAEEARP